MSQNIFGGKNENAVYVPTTDLEQEALTRIIESQQLTLKARIKSGPLEAQIKGVIFGDKRFTITLEVQAGVTDAPLSELDLTLLWQDHQLIQKSYPTEPMVIPAGTGLELEWAIALDHINPALVKRVVPSAIGLTSRRLDRDTGERTLRGNMALSPEQHAIIQRLDRGEKKARKL